MQQAKVHVGERENVLDGATNKVELRVNIFYWSHSRPMVPVDYP